MKKMFAGLVLTAGLLAVTGCQSAFNESDVARSNAPSLKVEITDKDLAESLHVFQTGRVKTEGGYTGYVTRGRMKRGNFFAWVFCSYKPVPIEYRYAWYRADGQEICTPHTVAWKQIRLYDGQEFSASDMAPVSGIDRAIIFIRPVQAPDLKKNAKAATPAPKEAKAATPAPKEAKAATPAPKEATAGAAPSAEASPMCIPADTTHVDSVSGSGKISAAQLNQQVNELRNSISEQIQLDKKGPGVSITENDVRKAKGVSNTSEQVHGKNSGNVSDVAVSIMKDSPVVPVAKKDDAAAPAPVKAAPASVKAAPAPVKAAPAPVKVAPTPEKAAPAKAAPAEAAAPAPAAKGTCRCGCIENPGFKCYCSAGSDCPAAKAKKK